MPTGADVTDKSIAKRPPHLAHGRWLGDFAPLNAAEKKLLAACTRGEFCTLNTGERPKAAGDAYIIRAALIRFLVLGGDAANPVHERGVLLQGAWIIGGLDLVGVKTEAKLLLIDCHFDSPLTAKDARLAGLYLNGSTVPGLDAERMVVTGGVFLRAGFTAHGEVRLLHAQIGGSLECDSATLQNYDTDGNAIGNTLSADGIVVKGGVFLRDGFTAHGAVRLLGAQIGGSLYCIGGTFQNCDKDGNTIGKALNADGMVVKGGVFLRGGKFTGAIDLATAHIGTLVDDANCWPANSNFLDGLRYDRIIGPTDAATRIDWLNRQQADYLGADFRPQPWEQLIKVLREMGHPAEAAEVAIAKQVALRKAGKIGLRHPSSRYSGWRLRLDKAWVGGSNIMARAWHRVYGVLAGFGHRPADILVWMVAVFMASAVVFHEAAILGQMGPANAIMLTHEAGANVDIDRCGVRGDVDFAHFWRQCPQMPPEYTTFNPWLYSLDLILPLVNLQQDSDWAPVVMNSHGDTLWLGWWARNLMWFEILFGWFTSLMFVAITGRLVEKD